MQRMNGTRISVKQGEDIAVRVGDEIETHADTYASITYFDGSTTELDPQTTIILRELRRLPAGHVSIGFEQKSGQSWNRAKRSEDTNGRDRVHSGAYRLDDSTP